MWSFKHPSAGGARVRYVRVPGGGLCSDTLIVTAIIPLESGAPGYDLAAVAALDAAAVIYARQHGYRAIEFEQA